MKRRNEEQRIQAAVWQHFQIRRWPDAIGFAVPNGGKRNPITAVILRRTGVVPGVSDFIFMRRGQAFALELKTAKGSATDAQTNWLIEWGRAGGIGGIARGLDAALDYLKQWDLVR